MAKIFHEPSRTFGEYLLLPRLTTEESIPSKIDLKTPLVRHRRGEKPDLQLNIPFVSAIMQAVSNDSMAISLAREGGLSFIYCSQPIDNEVEMVTRVKKHKEGFVVSDTNLSSSSLVEDVYRITTQTGHSTVAITEDGTLKSKFLGLVTTVDYYNNQTSRETPVTEIMIPVEEMICGNEGITLKEANDLIRKHRLVVLPVLDNQLLTSMVFRKDLREHCENPYEITDHKKRLMVGAGVNTHDYEQRVPALVEAGADVLCLDSSDGFSIWQQRAIAFVKKEYGGRVKIGAGNVVARDGFDFLADAGADFIKVGIGGGAICITRDQKALGRGQASALLDVCAARDDYYERTGEYVPVCSDGGIVHDYHIIIALAMGADFLMLGRYFSRFDESPTDIVTIDSSSYKEYWGEGSNRARNWQRYGGEHKEMVFEEGIDSYVPYAGRMKDTLNATIAKLKSTMCNCGSNTLCSFYQNSVLTVVSELSLREGSVHDVLPRNKKIE